MKRSRLLDAVRCLQSVANTPRAVAADRAAAAARVSLPISVMGDYVGECLISTVSLYQCSLRSSCCVQVCSPNDTRCATLIRASTRNRCLAIRSASFNAKQATKNSTWPSTAWAALCRIVVAKARATHRSRRCSPPTSLVPTTRAILLLLPLLLMARSELMVTVVMVTTAIMTMIMMMTTMTTSTTMVQSMPI